MRTLRLVSGLLWLPWMAAMADFGFENATDETGLGHYHDYTLDIPPEAALPMPLVMAGGVAAADYDRDGDVDLYLATGNRYPNVLLRNDGGGQFEDVAPEAGVAADSHLGNGPAFADIDADGWPDLVIGGIIGSGMRVFRNLGDGSFEEVTEDTGILLQDEKQNDYSTAFGDPDGDGDLDIYVGHWGTETAVNHLWVNQGNGRFHAGDDYSGLAGVYADGDWSFTPSFADVDGDARADLLVTSDYQTSHTLINRGGLQFEDTTTEVIDDRAGMGSAIGDFDNDGDQDWFVTAIWWDEGEEGEGNRLYENDGLGQFSNITETAGVLEGDWGWGACAQDFNNDGWLDLFHVNGMIWETRKIDYFSDPSRMFINRGDGTFDEKAIDLGIEDDGMGKGVVCFDADLDGDIDIFTANTKGKSQFYRNTLTNNPGWLQVTLEGETDNPSAVGAVVKVTTGELTQTREIRIGSNYLSQDPLIQHFGLGGSDMVDEVRVFWPHGGETLVTNVTPNQSLSLAAQDALPAPFTVRPGLTSAWYDPSHNGEGFILEMLGGGYAAMYWFTYDKDGNQDWFIGVGKASGRRFLVDELLRISGGEFGAGFDPSKITETAVGTASFTWTGCDEGFMDWTIGTQMGRQELRRITRVMGLACDTPDEPTSVAGFSGSWYDPSHRGEGYNIEILADGRPVVYWFSYDKEGNRRWFFGVGEVRDGKLVFDQMFTTKGGIFGENFDPTLVETPPWGTLVLDLDCNTGTATYTASEEGFDSGVLNIQRLTTLDGLACS